MSKFYPQIQRTHDSYHIYISERPAINVKASFCALNLRKNYICCFKTVALQRRETEVGFVLHPVCSLLHKIMFSVLPGIIYQNNMRHLTKFRRDRLNRCQDMAI